MPKLKLAIRIPTIPNGNLNGPTIMLAERAANLIKGKGLLKRS
jgi:choline dehydrogenase